MSDEQARIFERERRAMGLTVDDYLRYLLSAEGTDGIQYNTALTIMQKCAERTNQNMVVVLCDDINWATGDGDAVEGLPQQVAIIIQDEGDDNESIADQAVDKLSDQTGWLVNGAVITIVRNDNIWPIDTRLFTRRG